MSNKPLLIFFSLIFSLFISCKAQTTMMESPNGKFKAGQIWKYDNRNGEDSSTLTILKIERYEKGDVIIHIRVDHVKIFSPTSKTGYSDYIGHLPYSEQAMLKSVRTLVGQVGTLPDFKQGYDQWKEAWDSGKGGYWTIDLKEAIEGVDQASRQKK